MNDSLLQSEIIEIIRKFNATGLSMGTSGNISVRTKDGFLITPSGVAYDEMLDEDIVLLDMKGCSQHDGKEPSTEWRIHRDVYNSRRQINAIVHTHSCYATAIACTRRGIPAFHYEVAVVGGDSIQCAEYATFGTQELSDSALAALQDRSACLLANHGQLALGSSIKAAFKMAQAVEVLAKQYTLSNQLGGPVLLDKDEMKLNLEKFKHYGPKAD